MTDCAHQASGMVGDTVLQEFRLSLFKQFFPRASAESVLKGSDAFKIGIFKDVAKNAVVSNAELPTVIMV